ncbi:MAG: sulfotransferase, partial [Acidimicrobiia bacterium]|nr:sulfotransferase [Acidimicrobiia bacterium]
EEIQLLAVVGSTMLYETMAPMPTWRDHYLATDQTPFYEGLKALLAVLAHQSGDEGRRWVLKSPQHVEQLGPLLSVFPDATVVCTHRDPVAVTQSMATMLAYTARTSQVAERIVDVGRYWVDRSERMFRSAVDQRSLVPGGQSIDVLFHEFMADDVAMVERIYEVADQPFTSEVRAHMATFMAEHPRGKHGSVLYDLGDFGIDPAERRAALGFYVDRFGVELEV